MAYFLFNRKHFVEYTLYGCVAGSVYVLAVWYYLHSSYRSSPALIIGSGFFMLVIMFYALKLSKRQPENSSVWGMIISGHITVAVGILFSVIGSLLLCFIYIPGFLNGEHGAKDPAAIGFIFITATFGNYGVGAFISAMIAYALKPDQTEDKTLKIFEESEETTE